LWLNNTGTNELRLNACAFGININPAAVGGTTGTVAFTSALQANSNDVSLAPVIASASTGVNLTNPNRHIRFTTTGAGMSAANAPSLPFNTWVRVGTIVVTLTNPTAWVANTTPNLSMVLSGGGLTATNATVYIGTATTSTSLSTVAGSRVLAPVTCNPVLNAPTCTAATLSSVITNQTCSNVNNGAIDLTATGGSPAPSFAWTKVGGGFNAVSEDISGLAPGDYTVVATSGTCSSTATYTVGAGAEATTVPSTVSACGSYTWPQNGQTYTASGTYTAVSGCTTYELTLNVTPIPVQPTLACYETATFNNTTCSWDVTGTQPVQPTLACYQTATFNNTTCSWDVTGTQPVQPTLACYETATFNTTTCSWDVTGTQPVQPTLACYQTATFNNTTCSWDVTGTMPVQPTLACYETATFNTTTCSWDVTGTQPVQPTLACYQTATFNNTTCSWDVTGEPNPVITTTASACDLYTWTVNGQTYTASGTYSYSSNCQDYSLVLTITGVSSTNTSTVTACGSYTWSANGTTYTQSGSYTYVSGCNTEILNLTVTPIPAQPTLACYETATFNSSTCSWDVTGTQPAQPTLACYETATFNNTTCSWDVTGTQPVQPTLACYETATFNNTTCSWDVTGTMPVQPTLACYQTATFNNTTCSWDVTGEPNPVITTTATSCDTYVWSVNGQTYAASGTYSYSSNCQDYSLVLTINTSVTYYADADLDGYGDANSPVTSCTGMPSGAVANSGDCNDNNGNINPGATEVCGNGIDDNCDGNVDEGCGCTNPPTANAGLNASVCEGQTVSLNGTIGGGANNATWTSSGSGSFSPSANVLNATYVPSSADYAAGSVTLTLTTDATAPCTAATSSMTVTFNALPSGAGAISGTTAICNPLKTLFTYSVAAVQGASSYTWTVPVGATIIGSSNGTSISVRFVDANVQVGINGPITVTPNNSNGCGNPAPSVLNISVNITVPVTPPSISGATKVCPGDIVTYSIANVARATSYNWSVPSGASILSGAGSNVITVQYTSVVGGTLSVIAVNSCGTSPARTATITQNILPAAASISGPIDGLCGLTGVVYSVTPVSGAVSYVWTVPSGASIVGSSSGSSIVVDFSGSFTTGSVTVAASNNCGTGLVRSLSVKAVPGLPGAISGPTTACTSSSGNVYSISTVSGATSYTWTVPGGATINSGQGSKIISVTFGSVPSSTGIVTVKASNACGLSAVKVLSVATINCPRVGTTTSLSMVAYPNPVSTELTVEFGSESAQNANITLRDAAGRIVYAESKAAAEGFNSAKVSVDGLASGIYMLQLQMNDRTEQIKVFVTK